MPEPTTTLGIDEYLRDRLMPMDEEISQIEGIEFFADSIPVTGGLIAGMQERDSADAIGAETHHFPASPVSL